MPGSGFNGGKGYYDPSDYYYDDGCDQGSYGASYDSSQYDGYSRYDRSEYVDSPRRGRASRVIFVIALVVFICAVLALGYIFFTYWSQQNAYDQVEKENFSIEEEDAITLADFHVDWDALHAINPDVVGWVYVPNTQVSYPIAYRENDDSYYLYHNFSGEENGQFGAEYGSIFLSGINQPDMRDQVNIIYGHNMLNGEMFSIYADFIDSDVFNANRYAYVLTPVGNYLLEAFAVDEALGYATDIPVANFETQEEFDEYLQKRIDESVVTPDPPAPPIYDITQVFAFSTCQTANDSYRAVTFYCVKEFLPEGSRYVQANSLVSEDDVAAVNRDAAERAQ